ncbi:MAG: DNA polymerase, partial [Rectinema subterraneum]
MTSGTIIHVNVIGLMAAVEEVVDPGVRGRPFVVARPDIPRAIVLDLSPEAYREGVRRGMLVQTACARVRALKVVPPRPELYEK